MLNAVIRAALKYRVLVAAAAVVLMIEGAWTAVNLPIDVFPDLNRPRVTVLTEALGLAPEEVETLISAPLESAMNGATGVQTVRSSSGIGLSAVVVEFQWGIDIYVARQIVTEKLALARERLPRDVSPVLAPISSIVGQVLQVGLTSETRETDPIQLRTLADWVVRQRLLGIAGVAQVTVIGGGRRQYQVLVDAERLRQFDVTLGDVERAVAASNANAAGGFLHIGPREYLVRGIGRIHSAADLEFVVVKSNSERPIVLKQVARVVEAAQVKRGDAHVNGLPAVILTISKQPGSDTRRLTRAVLDALDELKPSLPRDVTIHREIYQQQSFVERSLRNVIEALRDGGILVVVVLLLFLMNLRITFITLTAIPLSLAATALVFQVSGLSINTMTLGGLAVAIGELVDDAIVDAENIFRRLRENALSPHPRPRMQVVYEASQEVRGSIVFSTLLVILVFIPLFSLDGMEGRLFVPLALAYIVSILASLAVSLTVTPVLSYWFLGFHTQPRAATPTDVAAPHAPSSHGGHPPDGWLLRVLKRLADRAICFSLSQPRAVLWAVACMTAMAVYAAAHRGRDFLPPFNEGCVQLNTALPPGSSLEESNRVSAMVDAKLKTVKGVLAFGRRNGRAELDEHADGVEVSETIVSLDPKSSRTREEVLEELRDKLAEVPGIEFAAEQPLQHLMSEMLSGVKAQIAIKIVGDDLPKLRSVAQQVKARMASVAGVKDLMVEPQVEIQQLQIRLKRPELSALGLNTDDVNALIETAIQGRVTSEVFEGQRKFDLVVRLDDPYRMSPQEIERLAVTLPNGARVPLSAVADVLPATGPNQIKRENVRRRLVVQCNVAGRDAGGVVDDIKASLADVQNELPTGYLIEYSGQFESQRAATQRIGLLSIGSLILMFLALYVLFDSSNLALQVLSALPMAAIGAVAALVITNQTFTVASLVGFISLAGIASRNGILLIAHYRHLVTEEGESLTTDMIRRAGLERLAPMLMTALTAGIALIPLVLAAGEPGKEILHPVATVIFGGLISSTLLDFFVHPALFWLFGRADVERLLSQTNRDPNASFEAT